MRKKITVSDFILLALEKSIDGFIRFEDFASNPGYYAYWDGWNYPLKKNSLSQALRRLRLYGYIDLEEYNNKLVLKLTDTGKLEALLRKILLDDKWDGKWRIIIFDIPEKHKKIRDVLRSKLKTWGLVPWQKSVWASKKDVTKLLREFVKKIGIEKWVVILESTDSPDVTNY